jgi:hypothetical protein
MTTKTAGAWHSVALIGCGPFLAVLLGSCAASHLRIYMDSVPPGSLRLAQVTALGKREEILQMKPVYDALVSSGIADADIVDASVVLARIYCCGGITKSFSAEEANAIMMYVKKDVAVGLGDVVEVEVGHEPRDGGAGEVNRVTRVIESYDTFISDRARCWWDPKNENLWLRLLYCDWMPNEGWVKQGGLSPTWYKPRSSGSPGQ